MNAFGAERLSPSPTWHPGVPETRDTLVDELGQENQMLDPQDVRAYSSNPPPDFEIVPVDFSDPVTPPESAATHPTTFEELIDLEAPSGIRERARAVPGKTVEELSVVSKEYIQVRRKLADFVYSDVFREQGCNAITNEIIHAIERFHRQDRSTENDKKKYEEERQELENLLRRVPPSTMNPALHAQGVSKLLDFVKDPRKAPSGVRERTRAATGKTVEEFSADSKECIQLRKALEDFISSEAFREQGRDAITDEIINTIELFHAQPRSSEQSKIRHDNEQKKLVELLLKAPPSTMNPVLHAQGVSELLDFVSDPFFCHGMWRQCVLKPYVDSMG